MIPKGCIVTLSPLELLNEVQKQRQLVEEQQKTNEAQNDTIARQQEEIQDLAARVVKLETLLAAKR